MAEPILRRFAPEEFFRWLAGRAERHELVDGAPVAMAGANQRHDRIVTNALLALGPVLRARGDACRPFTLDTAVAIPSGNIRYPDLGIDCGPFDDGAMVATAPRLVVEVLSPSNADFDRFEKPEEYKTVPSIDHILIVDPLLPRVRLHSRHATGAWHSARIDGLEATIELPALDLELPMAELYRGLAFRPRPTLVETT